MTAASDIDCLPQQRKIEIESGALFGRTLDMNLAGVLLDDAVGYGESESGASLTAILRDILCGKEWVVYSR
jgi:hypothetical protein